MNENRGATHAKLQGVATTDMIYPNRLSKLHCTPEWFTPLTIQWQEGNFGLHISTLFPSYYMNELEHWVEEA